MPEGASSISWIQAAARSWHRGTSPPWPRRWNRSRVWIPRNAAEKPRVSPSRAWSQATKRCWPVSCTDEKLEVLMADLADEMTLHLRVPEEDDDVWSPR